MFIRLATGLVPCKEHYNFYLDRELVTNWDEMYDLIEEIITIRHFLGRLARALGLAVANNCLPWDWALVCSPIKSK